MAHLYDTPPREVIHARIKKNPESRDRLLQLAEKSHRADHRHSAGYSPELRPKMGLRAKDKCRSSMFVSEQSLPDKLTQALKHLRPGNIAHSSSSSAPFKNKNKGSSVAADDVVYISAPEPRTNKKHYGDFEKKRHHSVLVPFSPSPSDLLVPVRDPTLKDLDQIRNLYKSVPNVSTMEDNDFRSSRRFADDLEMSMSCSTRSPTDSGYRSTPRHLTEENPYMLDDDIGVSHKTTTVVHINGDSSPELVDPILRVHGPQLVSFQESLKSYGILNESSNSPISERDIISVLQGRRCRRLGSLIDLAIVPRLLELIFSELLKLGEHMQRLSSNSLKITIDDVTTATKISYPVDVFSSCNKAGSQAMAIYALSGTGALKKSFQQRAELRFPLGKIYRWIVDMNPNKPISDNVPVFLTAVLECLVEETVQKLVKEDRSDVMKLTEFEAAVGATLSNLFQKHDMLRDGKNCSTMSKNELLSTVDSQRHRIVIATEGSLSSGRSKKRSLISLSRGGSTSLYYFAIQKVQPNDPVCLSDWTRLIFAFAEHRLSPTVDDCDVQQAARLLLGIDCAPPTVNLWRHDVGVDCTPAQATTHFAFSLIATGVPENIHHATHFLHDKLHGLNPFGLTALAESVVRGDEETTRLLMSAGCAVNVGVPKSKADNSPYLLAEYTGWSPLTWAIAGQNQLTAELLLNNGAELQNDTMIKEAPLQVAVQTGHVGLVERLLECGADPFRSSIVYDSAQACFRNHGCPSPLALACARGNHKIVDTLLNRLEESTSNSSVDDFLRNERRTSESEKTDFQHLPHQLRLSLQEALYYSVETSRPEIAVQLRDKVSGLPWNIYTWTRAVQGAAELQDSKLIERLLSDFGPKIVTELNEDNFNYTFSVLFSLVKRECRRENGSPKSAAFAISRLWHYFNQSKSSKSKSEAPKPRPNHRTLIDASFVNNEHLSDVRFRVDGETVYGHRIVLFNVSEKFKTLLQSPNGIIDITNVSHAQFLAMMSFLYTGDLPPMDVRALFSLTSVADVFSLPSMREEVVRTLANSISPSNIADIYQFAIVHTSSLLEECERFVLEQFDTVVSSPQLRQLLISPSSEYDLCSALSLRLTSAFDDTRANKQYSHV